MPPYVIAEISGNHNGDIGRAKALIKVAKESGADAVKFQTYDADSLTLDLNDPRFRISGGSWSGKNLYELYQEASTPWLWFKELFEFAKLIDITAFSTPFCNRSFDLLESLEVPAYKIASNEITDWPLVQKVARSGRPVILSTGTASKDDISKTVEYIRSNGCEDLVVLHCISAYPATAEDSNLRTLVDLKASFNVEVGLSDHTMGVTTSVAAVALGAVVVEKHFTLSRVDGGVDSHFSLEPDELKRLVEECRLSWDSLGCVKYGNKHGLSKKGIFLRQLWAVENINPGERFSHDNVRSIRGPSSVNGLSPMYFEQLFNRRAERHISKNEPILPKDLNGGLK